MAFESIGLGGVLTFNSNPAMVGLQTAQAGFRRLSVAAQTMATTVGAAAMRVKAHLITNFGPAFAAIGLGLGKLKAAAMGLFVAALPMAYGMMKALKGAAQEQKSLSNLSAEANLTAEQLKVITERAKDIGTSGWQGTEEAIRGMNRMAVAGARYEEIMKGIGGVSNFAAAMAIDMGEAADVLMPVVRRMGMDFSDLSKTVDVFTVVSQQSGINMKELATTFKEGGVVARDLGLSVEDTAAIFGIMSREGERGKRAGLALGDMFNRLMKPSAIAQQTIQQWGISMTDASGKMLPLNKIVGQFQKRLDAIPNQYKRTALIQELFGIKGSRVYNALNRQAETYQKTMESLDDVTGAAERMADERHKNILDYWGRLKGGIEEGAKLFMAPVLEPLSDMIKSAFLGVEAIVASFRALSAAQGDANEQERILGELAEKHGEAIPSIAMGLVNAAKWMKDAWAGLIETVSNFGNSLKSAFGPKVYGKISEFVAKFAAFSTILIPVGGAMAIIGLIAKKILWPALVGILHLLKGMALFIKAAFLSPLGIAFALLIGMLIATKKEGEGIMDVFAKIFTFLDDTIGEFIRGFMSMWGQVWVTIKQIFSAIGRIFDSLFGWLFRDTTETTGHMKAGFHDAGKFIGSTFLKVMNVIAGFFDAIGKWIIESRDSLEDFFADVESVWIGIKQDLGIIGEDEYRKEARRINRIRNMIAEQSKQHQKELKAEAEKWVKLQEEASREAEMEVGGKREKRPQVNVDVKLEDKRQLEIKNSMCVNGKEVAFAVANQNKEIQERAGFKANWWQRRAAAEYAALPTRP